MSDRYGRFDICLKIKTGIDISVEIKMFASVTLCDVSLQLNPFDIGYNYAARTHSIHLRDM